MTTQCLPSRSSHSQLSTIHEELEPQHHAHRCRVLLGALSGINWLSPQLPAPAALAAGHLWACIYLQAVPADVADAASQLWHCCLAALCSIAIADAAAVLEQAEAASAKECCRQQPYGISTDDLLAAAFGASPRASMDAAVPQQPSFPAPAPGPASAPPAAPSSPVSAPLPAPPAPSPLPPPSVCAPLPVLLLSVQPHRRQQQQPPCAAAMAAAAFDDTAPPTPESASPRGERSSASDGLVMITWPSLKGAAFGPTSGSSIESSHASIICCDPQHPEDNGKKSGGGAAAAAARLSSVSGRHRLRLSPSTASSSAFPADASSAWCGLTLPRLCGGWGKRRGAAPVAPGRWDDDDDDSVLGL